MSIHRPTKRVHPSAAVRLLDLFAQMETPGFKFYEWQTPVTATEEKGRTVMFIGGPTYHPVVHQLFWELLYESSLYIDPYAALPEDPSREGAPFDVMEASFPAAYFTTATIDQVRRYLVFCTRAERFCDGRMASEWDSGALPAALRRFRELWRSPSKAKAERDHGA